MYTVDPWTSDVHHVSLQVLAGQPATSGWLATTAVAVSAMLAGFAVDALVGWVRKVLRRR